MKTAERDELLIRLDERTHEINKDIKDVRKVLHGNGQEGICDTVLKHDTTLKNVKWGLGIFFTAVIVALGIFEFII